MRKIVAKNSLYDTYFSAGQSAGKYEAQKQEVGDVWSDIDYSKQLTAQKGAQRERTLDTILAATEMVSTVGQGMEAKKEWEGHLGRVEGSIGEKGQRIGRSGKAWEDTSFMEKLFSGKEYKFGSGESARVMGKSDITAAGQTLQYGGKVDFKRFKPESAAAELVDNNQLSPESSKFYGERKGFDMGDIIGEKSVFAAGLNKGNKPPPPPEPERPKVKIESEEVDIADDVEVKDIETEVPSYKTWDPLEDYTAPEVGDTRPGQKTEPLINRVIGLGRDIGQNVWDLWN
jgi:hypothetical protein